MKNKYIARKDGEVLALRTSPREFNWYDLDNGGFRRDRPPNSILVELCEEECQQVEFDILTLEGQISVCQSQIAAHKGNLESAARHAADPSLEEQLAHYEADEKVTWDWWIKKGISKEDTYKEVLRCRIAQIECSAKWAKEELPKVEARLEKKLTKLAKLQAKFDSFGAAG